MRSASLTFLGHSTVRISLGGVAVLTDPVIRPRVGLLSRRGEPADLEDFRVEIVLISHGHHDHLDLRSLHALQGSPTFIVPHGLAGVLHHDGLVGVREIRAQEVLSIGGISVVAVRAVHDGRRLPRGPAADALGFVIGDESIRIYFAGDTDLFDAMADLGRIDVALIPVWGWGPRLGPGHLDPIRAARAVTMIRPTVAIPIHWGTLWPIGLGHVRASRLDLPPLEFKQEVERLAPDVRVAILAPGERIELPDLQEADASLT